MASDDRRSFPVVFDTEKFFELKPVTRPRERFVIEFGVEGHEELVRDELLKVTRGLFREPTGVIKYPYIVPGCSYNQLWDWDAFFCGLGVCEEKTEYFVGSVLNFLDHTREDGQPPFRIIPEEAEYWSLPLPLFAQWCAVACRLRGDHEWVRPWWDVLCRQREWYERECGSRRGLFRLKQWAGNGLDNDPVLYGRRRDTVAAVHVMCYHYREYAAMGNLAEALGLDADARRYGERGAELAEAINYYMWDDRDGMYYHLDLSDWDDVRYQEITWELPYKVKSWACLFPLWAGICSEAQAERLVREHVMNEGEFLSGYGIRSLSADERMYNNVAMGNPSNWQGPVWGISTFLTAYGLLRYGYVKEAEEVARRLVDVFACDLKANGVVHEHYDGDTGRPMMGPGFLSWNLLAVRILDDIRKGYDPSGF